MKKPLKMSSTEQQQQQQSNRNSDVESDLSTMFILDLMRQKREKLMRLKKDELINEMAKKQREKMQQVRQLFKYSSFQLEAKIYSVNPSFQY